VKINKFKGINSQFKVIDMYRKLELKYQRHQSHRADT